MKEEKKKRKRGKKKDGKKGRKKERKKKEIKENCPYTISIGRMIHIFLHPHEGRKRRE